MNRERGNPTSIYDLDLFIFDMGNVVIRDIHVVEPISHRLALPVADFLSDIRAYDTPLMDGSISTSDYWRHVEKKFSVKVYGEPFADHFHPVINEPMAEVLKALKKKGKRVVCGSNTFAPHWDLLKKWGYTDVFDASYPSHEINISKPSRQYFEYILNAEKTMAHRAFFIDDLTENIATAKQLGITTCHYLFGPEGDKELIELFEL